MPQTCSKPNKAGCLRGQPTWDWCIPGWRESMVKRRVRAPKRLEGIRSSKLSWRGCGSAPPLRKTTGSGWKVKSRVNTGIRSQGAEKPREEKPEYLCCPICIDLMVEPLALSCGHCFCRKCLETSIEYKKECPMCRDPIKGIDPNPCLNMEAMIQEYRQ